MTEQAEKYMRAHLTWPLRRPIKQENERKKGAKKKKKEARLAHQHATRDETKGQRYRVWRMCGNNTLTAVHSFFFSAQHSVNMSDRPRCRAIYDPSSCFICMGSYSHSERNFHPYSVCCSFCLRPLHTQKKKKKKEKKGLWWMEASSRSARGGGWLSSVSASLQMEMAD